MNVQNRALSLVLHLQVDKTFVQKLKKKILRGIPEDLSVDLDFFGDKPTKNTFLVYKLKNKKQKKATHLGTG